MSAAKLLVFFVCVAAFAYASLTAEQEHALEDIVMEMVLADFSRSSSSGSRSYSSSRPTSSRPSRPSSSRPRPTSTSRPSKPTSTSRPRPTTSKPRPTSSKPRPTGTSKRPSTTGKKPTTTTKKPTTTGKKPSTTGKRPPTKKPTTTGKKPTTKKPDTKKPKTEKKPVTPKPKTEKKPVTPKPKTEKKPVTPKPKTETPKPTGPSSGTGKKVADAIVNRVGQNTKAGGRCAQYVREAIEKATGLTIQRTGSAKDYGPNLQKAGYKIVTGAPQPGDVAIYQSVPGHPHGHAQLYTNSGWYSDFKQRDRFPGKAYRERNAPMVLYRRE